MLPVAHYGFMSDINNKLMSFIKGADPDCEDQDRRTPLHSAIVKGSRFVLKVSRDYNVASLRHTTQLNNVHINNLIFAGPMNA